MSLTELLVCIGSGIALLIAFIDLYLRIRSIDKSIVDTIEAKLKEKEDSKKELLEQKKESDKKLEGLEDAALEAKFKQLWQKINSIDTQVNGKPEYDVDGLVVTMKKLKLVIKQLGGNIDE